MFYIAAMLSLGLCYLVYYKFKAFNNTEFEIEFINEYFSVAKVLRQKKRIELAEFSFRDCEYIGPVTSDRFEQDKKNANYVLKITDLKEFPIEDKYWYCFLTYESMKLVVVFHYKDEMYPVFRRYNPRNTEFYKITNKAEED